MIGWVPGLSWRTGGELYQGLACYSLGRLCSLVDVVVVRCCALFVTLLNVYLKDPD
jgi:hypothetical protein